MVIEVKRLVDVALLYWALFLTYLTTRTEASCLKNLSLVCELKRSRYLVSHIIWWSRICFLKSEFWRVVIIDKSMVLVCGPINSRVTIILSRINHLVLVIKHLKVLLLVIQVSDKCLCMTLLALSEVRLLPWFAWAWFFIFISSCLSWWHIRLRVWSRHVYYMNRTVDVKAIISCASDIFAIILVRSICLVYYIKCLLVS